MEEHRTYHELTQLPNVYTHKTQCRENAAMLDHSPSQQFKRRQLVNVPKHNKHSKQMP